MVIIGIQTNTNIYRECHKCSVSSRRLLPELISDGNWEPKLEQARSVIPRGALLLPGRVWEWGGANRWGRATGISGGRSYRYPVSCSTSDSPVQ